MSYSFLSISIYIYILFLKKIQYPRDPVVPSQKVRLDPPGTYITVSPSSPEVRYENGSLGILNPGTKHLDPGGADGGANIEGSPERLVVFVVATRFSVEKERTIAIQRPMGTPNLRSGCDAQRVWVCGIVPDTPPGL